MWLAGQQMLAGEIGEHEPIACVLQQSHRSQSRHEHDERPVGKSEFGSQFFCAGSSFADLLKDAKMRNSSREQLGRV
jgi:hypothetical protein